MRGGQIRISDGRGRGAQTWLLCPLALGVGFFMRKQSESYQSQRSMTKKNYLRQTCNVKHELPGAYELGNLVMVSSLNAALNTSITNLFAIPLCVDDVRNEARLMELRKYGTYTSVHTIGSARACSPALGPPPPPRSLACGT